MLKASQLQGLRRALPPLEQALNASDLPAFGDFNRFYGVDFETRFAGVSHALGNVASSGFRLAVHVYRSPRAVGNLLLVHGYLDHSSLYPHLIEYGLRRKLNVVAFDLPGHGLSSGEPAVIDDFSRYGQAVADVLAACAVLQLPWYAMAQSTGGAALVEYARTHHWPFVRCVLLAPLIRPLHWWRITLGHRLLHRWKDKLPRTFNRNCSNDEFLAFQREDPMQSQVTPLAWVGALRRWLDGLEFSPLHHAPVLMLQGDNDGTVDGPYNAAHMPELFTACEVQWLEGAGHQLANESPAIRRDYLARCDRFFGFLPEA